MAKRKKYKLFKNKEYIGEFYVSEISEMTGITARSFHTYMANGQTYKGCYTFEEGQERDYTQKELELMKQWDKYRKILNPKAKEEIKEHG